MSTPPDAASYFGVRSSHYDSRYDRLDADGHALRARMGTVISALGPGPGEVLDAGMGPGRLCAELRGRGWTVSGLDASPEMVAAARSRLPDDAERLVEGTIENLPWGDASFDAVTATGVLEYADVPQALAELARVLRPGGRAVVSYPNPRALYGVWKTRVWYRAVRTGKHLLRRGDPSMPRGAGMLSSEQFEQRLRNAGLEPGPYWHVSCLLLPTPLDLLLPRAAARLGARLERRARRRHLVATQIVYTARKPT